MSRISTSSVKKGAHGFLHILIKFAHKLRMEFELFLVNLVKLATKFRDGVPWHWKHRCKQQKSKGKSHFYAFQNEHHVEEHFLTVQVYKAPSTLKLYRAQIILFWGRDIRQCFRMSGFRTSVYVSILILIYFRWWTVKSWV